MSGNKQNFSQTEKNDEKNKVFLKSATSIRRLLIFKGVPKDSIDDLVHDAIKIMLEKSYYYKHHDSYAIGNLVTQVIRDSLQKAEGGNISAPIREGSVPDFYEKVKAYRKRTGYSEHDAKIEVRKEYSQSRGRLTHQATQADNDNRDISDWMSLLNFYFKELSYLERSEIRQAVKGCFFSVMDKHLEKAPQKKKVLRNFKILEELIFEQESQTKLAKKYKLSDASITNIKKEYMPDIEDCVAESLDLDVRDFKSKGTKHEKMSANNDGKGQNDNHSSDIEDMNDGLQ